MMEIKRKIAAGIVRFRTAILVAVLVLAAVSVTLIGKTRINYDLTRYLSEDTMTRRALSVMQEEFGSSEQLRVMFRDLEGETLDTCVRAMSALDEVSIARHDPETDVREKDDATYQLVTLTLNECDAAALVTRLRGMFPEAGEYAVGGSAASSLDLQRSVGAEIPRVMAISVAVVLIVLLLTSRAWLEPLVILIVLAVSILINMGTNFIFPDVSFITFAVSAILQLALSIDYAIMLLHVWNGLAEEGRSPIDAMTEALIQCFMRIASSAFTTAAGLLSLLFMSFTIGFDIGLVLTKGILISMLGVFLLMPAVTLVFEKGLARTRHKPFRLGGAHLARFVYRFRGVVAAALILAVLGGASLQTTRLFTFTDNGQSTRGGDSARISAVFGSSNPLVLLVPGGDTDEDYDRQRALVEKLKRIYYGGDEPAVGEITAMVTAGAAALEYYTPQDVAELTGQSALAVTLYFAAQGYGTSVRADRLLSEAGALAEGNEEIAALQNTLAAAQSAFNGPHYARMLVELTFRTTDTPGLRRVIGEIEDAVRGVYGDNFYITGGPMSTYDIAAAFQGDLMRVNLITLLAIFLIVALSFRAVILPLILVFVIEGSIWINVALSRADGIFFMCYLICVAIQMGATIDYGILLSDQYRALRRGGHAVEDALSEAMSRAMPTILTSGVILVTAGYIVGRACSIYYISSIGLLLSRGAAISVFLILTLLPALLALCDRAIVKPEKQTSIERRF